MRTRLSPWEPIYYWVLRDSDVIDSGTDRETAYARARDAKAEYPDAEVVIEERRWRYVQAASGETDGG